MTWRVLIVDDEAAVRRAIARLLMSQGHEVLTAEDGEAALSLLGGSPIDVMLLDLKMPKVDSSQLLARVKREHAAVEVVVMSGLAEIEEAAVAVERGAYDFLIKPFLCDQLVLQALSRAIEHKRGRERMGQLERRLERHGNVAEVVGSSPAMRAVHRLAMSVASATSCVLIEGAAGTGKHLLARAIHQHGPRAGRSFVAVDCSALHADVIEQELFGGGEPQRPGALRAAHGGTLMLREVGHLSASAQVRLLRFLRTGELSEGNGALDVRLLSGSREALRKRVEEGAFQSELYYRLSVVSLHLPSLCNRKSDIALLSHHFMDQTAKRLGSGVRRISNDALRMLREQPWPGNVRELEGVIERAVILARSEVMLPVDLPFGVGDRGERRSSRLQLQLPDSLLEMPFTEAKKQAVQVFEGAYVGAILQRTGNNIAEAARQSGLDRSNFRRVLRKGRRAYRSIR